MILHLILFPVNAVRLVQIRHLVQGITSLQGTDLSIENLLPFMVHRRYRAGDTLTRKGERTRAIMYLTYCAMRGYNGSTLRNRPWRSP